MVKAEVIRTGDKKIDEFARGIGYPPIWLIWEHKIHNGRAAKELRCVCLEERLANNIVELVLNHRHIASETPDRWIIEIEQTVAHHPFGECMLPTTDNGYRVPTAQSFDEAIELELKDFCQRCKKNKGWKKEHCENCGTRRSILGRK